MGGRLNKIIIVKYILNSCNRLFGVHRQRYKEIKLNVCIIKFLHKFLKQKHFDSEVNFFIEGNI